MVTAISAGRSGLHSRVYQVGHRRCREITRAAQAGGFIGRAGGRAGRCAARGGGQRHRAGGLGVRYGLCHYWRINLHFRITPGTARSHALHRADPQRHTMRTGSAYALIVTQRYDRVFLQFGNNIRHSSINQYITLSLLHFNDRSSTPQFLFATSLFIAVATDARFNRSPPLLPGPLQLCSFSTGSQYQLQFTSAISSHCCRSSLFYLQSIFCSTATPPSSIQFLSGRFVTVRAAHYR